MRESFSIRVLPKVHFNTRNSGAADFWAHKNTGSTAKRESMMSGSEKDRILDIGKIDEIREKFLENPRNIVAMNAATRAALNEVALNRDVINNAGHIFSIEMEPAEITDQKKNGTCWIYAELNWLRTFGQAKHKIKNLALSHNYLVFWDKFEKANYFYEMIIKHIDEEPDGRRLLFLLSDPTTDGGEWHMLHNLIAKYGMVPAEIMPDTFNRENSSYMNQVLGYSLRQGAAELKAMHEAGKSTKELNRKKERLLEEAYRILAISLGVPPEKFTWGFRDTDKKFHREKDITPREFYDKYIGVNPDDVYTIASCPSSLTEFGKTYTMEFFQQYGRRSPVEMAQPSD